MIISCNECDSSFAVDDSLIKETGSKVRCSKCNSIFVAYPQSLDADDGESLELDGMTDELDLELDDLDGSLDEDDDLGAAGLTDDELDLDFGDDDDAADDELPDLGEFEDLAGLDDDALALDDGDDEFDDLDLNLETEDEELGLDLDGDDELDLADLDFDEADEAELDADDGADLDELDLNLDLDEDVSAGEELDDIGLDLAEEDPDGATAVGDFEEADELDLSDLELEMDDVASADDTADAPAEDLSLDLDLEEEPAGEAGAGIEEADELDLGDLELEMEDTSLAGDTADTGVDDINLELDLEEDTAGGAAIPGAGATAQGADELDLSDLEEIIDSGEAPAAAGGAGDLELDFDLEGEAGVPADDAAVPAGDSELDLTDLEQMLESDDAPAASDASEELDLQFDIDEQPAATGAEPSAGADSGGGAQDDDLLDIEQMLEQGDEDTADAELGDEELSLTMEAALDDAAKEADGDLDLDFDIDSELEEKEDLFDGSASDDDALESNLLDADDADFLEDTGVTDESQTTGVVTDDLATDDFGATGEELDVTDVMPVGDEAVAEAAASKPAKKRSKKPVLVAFLLLLLGVGVLIIPKSLGINIPYISDLKIPYLSDLDIKIPYLSDWLNPEEQDVAGNLRISPMSRTISGNFVNTAKAGQLFVIRGQVKNEYDHPRSFVKVTAKLYQKGQKLVRKSTVYVGNVIPDSELTGMSIAAINKRMKNKFGDKRSNLKIKTGKSVPFMVVFDKLPKNLDEYTVEVASSSI